MTSGRITIFDIAKEAGVSIATVSRVLSDSAGVKMETKQNVMKVIAKYDFSPSMIARGLHQRKSNTLGIVLPEITNPFYAELFNSADAEAQRFGYSMLLHRIEQNERVDPSFIDRLIEKRLDGVLLAGGIVECPTPEIINILARLQRYMPMMIFAPPIKGLDCIYLYVDLYESSCQSVRHLHALGHRRIALLGGDDSNVSSTEREKGFFDETRRLSLNSNAAYRHETGYTPASGEVGVLKLLSSIPRKEWPTALIAINDLVALGTLRQLHRMGMSVPGDFALIGCDNQFFAQYTIPPLTTVDLHTEELGRAAVKHLLKAREADAIHFTQMRESTLIIRESCGAHMGYRDLS
jgi:LacI family transcriptional regulator